MISQHQIGAINKKTNDYTHPLHAKKEEQYICIECKNDLVFRKGDIRIPHFAHPASSTCCFKNLGGENGESHIHETAKLLLKYILENKITLFIQRNCECKDCNLKIQYEIPPIDSNTVIKIEHSFQWEGQNKRADVAYITNYTDDNSIPPNILNDDNGVLVDSNIMLCIFEIYHTHRTAEEDRPNNINWFDLNAETIINEFNDFFKGVKDGIYLQCSRKEVCNSCFLSTVPKKGCIYFNQRGAGCGKTYESVQLINSNTCKNIFIYLTKLHSAKSVILEEFNNQNKDGRLSNFKMVTNGIHKSEMERQYKLTFTNNETNTNITVIIGTIDSFNCAVVDKCKLNSGADYFKEILRSIKKGDVSQSLIQNQTINYANKQITIDTNSMIIVDEAQDLTKEYFEAFDVIRTHTNIDIYIIGDKLQSIWGRHNIHTYIENIEPTHSNIVKSEGKNKVIRFHNLQFIEFVNNIIPFKKYNLPPIMGICDNPTCKYKHENDICPYTVFQIPYTDYTRCEYVDTVDTINKIIGYMKYEIGKYGYLPKNFMFIFPILKNNYFATLIENEIQKLWIEQFADPDYQKNVLQKAEYWKDEINNIKTGKRFYKFVHLHKSDESKPINLKESENSTRILSIHSSKGNGCEVVFLLGISEQVLSFFSKDRVNRFNDNQITPVDNLVYDSLLHVAITRQKKSLYVAIVNNGDDIFSRFNKSGRFIEDPNIKPNLNRLSSYNQYSNIKQYVFENESLFDRINECIIKPNDYKKFLPKRGNNKDIIDWGHHTVRYNVAVLRFLMLISKDVENQPFKHMLKNRKKHEIKLYSYREYYKILQIINGNSKDKSYEKNNIIPILLFSEDENSQYHKYANIIKQIMLHIQQKIEEYYRYDNTDGSKELTLCPIECVILYYMIEIIHSGSYSSISIMEIYSILLSYDSCADLIDEEHVMKNGCLCNQCFHSDIHSSAVCYSDLRKSIKNHYDNLNNVAQIYRNYKTYLTETLHIDINSIHYNLNKKIWYENNNGDFGVVTSYVIIGYSSTHVIFFTIKPSFNELNFNKIVCDSIFDTFILENNNEIDDISNEYKYKGKQIYNCILTFDSLTPVFYQIAKPEVEEGEPCKHDLVIKESIRNYLVNKYVQYHELIYKYYMWCIKNKPVNFHDTEIKYVLDTIKKEHNKEVLLVLLIPDYITRFFENKYKQYCKEKDKIKKVEIEKEMKYQKYFINQMDELMIEHITDFLKLY
jgi:hypothetical protein